MNSIKKHGGTAFPVLHTIDGNWVKEPLAEYAGMSLRDYFAAKVMAVFLQGAVLPPGFDAREQMAFTAGRAYEAADAMLRAREDA